MRTLLKSFLADLWGPNNTSTSFPVVISDSVKQALLKSLVILKVHGGDMKKRIYQAEPGEEFMLSSQEEDEWHLRVDLVRFEDYYPDPTGEGLYEIHRVERDLHEVLYGAETGMYDQEVVDQLIGMDYMRPEDEELSEADRNQNESVKPGFRKRVLLDEFWGTLLDFDGRVVHRNVVATVANERFLIRPPEANPFWHQESPFVTAPLIRVPHSVFHKALYDHASDLNLAINELYNLIVDGAIASVWGIKQLRHEDLEDPNQAAGGIKQGTTLVVKNTLPHNAKVLETVAEGDVPNEALAVYQSLSGEFTSAAMTNELKLGSIPAKQVLATEVLESSQSQNLMLDGIISDLENLVMSNALRKAWLVALQNADRIPDAGLNALQDTKVAMMIMRAQPEERFALFANKVNFKVFGLSQTLTRALDFQKLMAFLQAVGVNPMLFQAFLQKFSPDRVLEQLMITLNLNPEHFYKTVEEIQNADVEQQRIGLAAQLLGQGPQNAEGQPAGVAAGPGTGGSPQTAAIQQSANPATGLAPNA